MEGSEGITAPRKEYPRPRPRGVSDGEQLHTKGKERHSTQRHRNPAGGIANGFSEPERSGGVALAVSWTGVV